MFLNRISPSNNRQRKRVTNLEALIRVFHVMYVGFIILIRSLWNAQFRNIKDGRTSNVLFTSDLLESSRMLKRSDVTVLLGANCNQNKTQLATEGP